MSLLTEQNIRDALRDVKLSDGGPSLIELDLVKGVIIKEASNGYHVSFALEVDPQQGAALEPVRAAAEKAVYKLPNILSVSAVLTAHTHAPAAPQGKVREKLVIPGVTYIVAVASGKGGVGKSTTAVNLAVAMAMNGLKVGLLDADIYGPSIPRMMNLSGKPESRDDKKMIPKERFGMKIMSMGFLIQEDAPMIWRGPMVHSAITQLFRDVAWGDLDILIADMPPGTGDAQLTMAQFVPLSGAIIVSTPQDIALLDARKGLNMFARVDVPVLGIVENMSYFLCPHCHERSEIFSHGGARHEAEKLGVPFIGEVPLDIVVREKSDSGEPIAADKDSAIAKLYRDMAAGIWKGLTQS